MLLAAVSLQKKVCNCSSSHVLFATDRFEPNCEPNLGEVLNLESIHYCVLMSAVSDIKFINVTHN